MFPKSAAFMALAALALMAGCSRKPAASPDGGGAEPQAPGYAAPPSIIEVSRAGAGFRIMGAAPAGAQVRLASPSGAAITARADGAGRWSLDAPASPEGAIFGVSEAVQGRQVQAQGYLVLTPQGPAAQLRAGTGAIRLDPRPSPSLGALDFDSAGAAVVSGAAPAGSLVFLKLDGRQMGEGRTDDQGRYSISISQAIPRGEHELEVSGDNFANRATVAIGPAAPLVAGPMRLQVTKGGPRVDWQTPGGGLQSTILLD